MFRKYLNIVIFKIVGIIQKFPKTTSQHSKNRQSKNQQVENNVSQKNAHPSGLAFAQPIPPHPIRTTNQSPLRDVQSSSTPPLHDPGLEEWPSTDSVKL